MKKVKIVNVPGYNAGEVVFLADNRAVTYVQNGQATAVGWSTDPASGPQNRMLDTSESSRMVPRRRRTE